VPGAALFRPPCFCCRTLLSAPPVSWLTYGPDAIWEGTSPQRELLMHQLYLLKDSGFPRLDAELFAEKVQLLLSSGSR